MVVVSTIFGRSLKRLLHNKTKQHRSRNKIIKYQNKKNKNQIKWKLTNPI